MSEPIVEDVLDFSISGRRILLDGEPKFVLADTVWSIISDATDDELSYYLDKRCAQGFNAVVFSILPIPHDRVSREVLTPFDETHLLENGRWFLNERYFARLAAMLEELARRKLLLLPVGFWSNYVRDSSFARGGGSRYVMPPEVRRDYMALLSESLAPVLKSVLFVVSGDTSFHSDLENAEYLQISNLVRDSLPGVRLTYHLGPHSFLPDELAPQADVLIYQSGHQADHGDLTVDLATRYTALPDRKPLMNIEPPYEYHRLVQAAGRFGRREVRRAIWRSILSGASSGTGYGQHGVWGWCRGDDPWTTQSLSGKMLDWREGLHLPGALDAAFVRQVMDETGCTGIPFASVRAAAPVSVGWDPGLCSEALDGSVKALYLPYGGPVDLDTCGLGDEAPARVQAFDLETRSALPCHLRGSEGTDLQLDLPGSHGDVVAFLWYQVLFTLARSLTRNG